jgi:cob(I)alamin adenosyltransferase
VRPPKPDERVGLIQVYTGSGKGKTTAALGLALRAAGGGMRTYIGQFLKATRCGELKGVDMLAPYVTLEQYGRAGWVQTGSVSPEQRAAAEAGLARAREALLSGEYDIIVLDEINVAIHLGVLSQDQVLGLMTLKPPQVELILTGREAPQAILDRADLVTEMREVRHPFRRGVPARPGIEF